MRRTIPLMKVLGTLLDNGQDMYGLELLRLTGLKSGTLYPLLDRLVEERLIVGRWESDGNPAGPRRRFYRLTSAGAHEAHALRIELAIGGGRAWT